MRRIVVIILICIAAFLTYVAVQIGDPDTAAASTAADTNGIIVMSPAIAVILTDLGLADRIVGRHAFDIVLEKTTPIAGDMNGFDYERLLRLQPTHIFLEQSAQETPDRLRTLAADNGWTLHTLPLLALDDIPAAVELIAGIFPSDETQRSADALVEGLHQTMQPDPTIASRAGRVLPLYWTNPPGAAGPGSFHYEILERLGYRMALTEGGPYITLDPEDILRMDPDSILLLIPGADPDRLDGLLGPLANLDLRCVREGRVGVISHPLVNIPATSITGVVREILFATSDWTP